MSPLYGLAPGATWGGRRHEGLAAMSDLKLEDQEFVDADAVELPGGKESGGRGTVITLTTVIALLAATALTVLGLGAADTAVTNFDASSWVWSSGRSEVERVNGVTARVDTRAKIKDSQNHEIQITQTDKYLILRDLETGQVTALDLTTLQVSAVMPSTPGFGVSVALHGEAAFVIDSVLGQVRQLDPRTLSPSGDPITLPKGLTPGGFDGEGPLWIAVPSEGTVVSIQPGSGGATPKVVRTVSVASPGHDFELSALDSGVAVLDNTVQKLSVVGESVQTVDVPINKPGIMPDRTVGAPIAITVADDRVVVLVDGTNVKQLTVPGTGPVGPAVVYAGHVYTPDSGAGVVHETDASGKLLNDIKIPIDHRQGRARGPGELPVHQLPRRVRRPRRQRPARGPRGEQVPGRSARRRPAATARRSRPRPHRRSARPGCRRPSPPRPATRRRRSPGARPATTARRCSATSSRASARPSRSVPRSARWTSPA